MIFYSYLLFRSLSATRGPDKAERGGEVEPELNEGTGEEEETDLAYLDKWTGKFDTIGEE